MKLQRSPLAPDHFPELPAVRGLKAATGSRGFYAKRGLERDDVFLFVFPETARCAGVFTTSVTASDDVLWCKQALQDGSGKARALIVNAGNSNAFTGPHGRLKNAATVSALKDEFEVSPSTCFVAATGVIGEPLPDPNYIGKVVPDLASRLGPPDWEACARAFMTTDTFPKASGTTARIGDVEVALAGIAKGSGMIAPNMATMLAYVFTDASLPAPVLDTLLRQATERSFNAITVDGDTSTSDTLMLFATGAAGTPDPENADDPILADFAAALDRLCLDLATQIVRDGEGASKFVTIRVSGTETDGEAKQIAASIANSPLVKTALAANDANWGRIVMAAGKAGVSFDQTRLMIRFGDVLVAENGARAAGYSEEEATRTVSAETLDIHVSVGEGAGTATVYTCDLTHGYVDINGAYRT